jgi:hypothetical protein
MQRLLPATAARNHEHPNIFELEILILIILVYVEVLDAGAIRLSPRSLMSLRAIEFMFHASTSLMKSIKFR